MTTITPMGNVAVSMSGTTIMTSAKLTGMAPDTYYVAHYHNMGTGSTTDPCASGGMALMSSKIVGMSNKDGMLTLTGSVAKSEILQATYFGTFIPPRTLRVPRPTPASPAAPLRFSNALLLRGVRRRSGSAFCWMSGVRHGASRSSRPA